LTPGARITLLRIENLKAGDLPPLSFAIADGECLAVEAPSGGGKTRLLRAIADLDPAPGQVFVDGAERHEMTGPAWRRLVRYVAAEPAWWSDAPRGSMASDEAAARRLARLLPALGLETGLIDRPIAQCSTGERQRLALTRALLDGPRVLLLDEPTAALDPVSSGLVVEEIRYQLLSGASVVLVSHDAAEVGRLADARLQLAPMGAPAIGAAWGKS
jgi:ABC-type iron transport system FetAB ATPase subunit